uniref:Uncharacterized protein n=1 Tax=viral metagenome TaxID=1070528 RepID=A0A6C0JR41_9ZZZZ
MTSRDKLFELVEQVKDVLTSAQYQNLLVEVGKIVPKEIFRLDITYVDMNQANSESEGCGCHQDTTINTAIRDLVIYVRREDFKDSNWDTFSKFRMRFSKTNSVTVGYLLHILPSWQANNLTCALRKRLTDGLVTYNHSIRLKIRPVQKIPHTGINDLDDDEPVDESDDSEPWDDEDDEEGDDDGEEGYQDANE